MSFSPIQRLQRGWATRRNTGRGSEWSRRFRPRVEGLEDRCLLALGGFPAPTPNSRPQGEIIRRAAEMAARRPANPKRRNRRDGAESAPVEAGSVPLTPDVPCEDLNDAILGYFTHDLSISSGEFLNIHLRNCWSCRTKLLALEIASEINALRHDLDEAG